MATFAMPSHAFDTPLFSNYIDSSQMDYSTFDDFVYSDPHHNIITPSLTFPLDSRDNAQAYKRHASPASPSNIFYNHHHHHHHHATPPVYAQTSASNNGSINSASSSHLGSPMVSRVPTLLEPQDAWTGRNSEMQSRFSHGDTGFDANATHSDFDYSLLAGEHSGSGVDPSLIQQLPTPNSSATPPFLPAGQSYTYPMSPAASHASNNVMHNQQSRGSPTFTNPWPMQRRPSMHSVTSRSQGSPRSSHLDFEEEGKERTLCPYPDCGKSFKDLKAHMLTHQNERPEKCPITSCEFHKRGFARKYDRNRHLVTTHYKATIICGFCPGSGSSAEKSFNRTDVFKRHLVAVHGVEQNPSSAKKNSKDSSRQSPSLPENVTGKCSTCGNIFSSAQDLFEHLDDCVLRVVTQTDPCESTNEKNLRSMADDGDVKATMERHAIPNDFDCSYPSSGNDDGEDGLEEVEDTIVSAQAGKSGKGSMKGSKVGGTSLHGVRDGGISKNSTRPGLTYSKGGVALSAGKGRKKRKHYPQSWGCPTDKMKLKKRVLCVFDGDRRLWKDDMMLGNDFEVRVKLPDGQGYVTDLDVETMKRAEAFHDATEEERGPWLYTNYHNWNPTPIPPQMLS